jgi:hypothetical protein
MDRHVDFSHPAEVKPTLLWRMLVETGAIARQGLGYNARLCHLVRTEWQPDRAAERSPSLRRTIERIRDLAARNNPT